MRRRKRKAGRIPKIDEKKAIRYDRHREKREVKDMKRWLCLMMIATLLISGTAGAGLAEGAIPNQWGLPAATPTPAPAAFFFRGGIQWNMSREQVRGLEPIELNERTNESWSILYPLLPVDVSRYKADLVYMFHEDQLKMIQYDFGATGSAADFLYLTGALDSVYGEHQEPEAAEIVNLMDQIYPTYYRAESITSRSAWTAGDGTRIYQFYYSAGSYTILYANPADGAMHGVYVTTGL